MEKNWVDEKLKLLNNLLAVFEIKPENFFMEPTPEFYKKLESGNEDDLQEATRQLAEKLVLVDIPVVEYDWDIKMELEHAGQIKFMKDQLTHIRIPFFYVGKAHAIGAILAHEITHRFLVYKGIFFEDINENERFTDLATIAIGFGKLLLNGMFVEVAPLKGEGIVLGYLSPELILYAYQKVNEFRGIDPEIARKYLTNDVLNKIDTQKN